MPRRRRSTRRVALGRRGLAGRRFALWLTVGVAALQVAVLCAFWLYPDRPPMRGVLWQGLWARANLPSFYPLMALIVVGLPATWLALAVRGGHRWVLLLAWAMFLPWLFGLHGRRVAIMLEIVWRHA